MLKLLKLTSSFDFLPRLLRHISRKRKFQLFALCVFSIIAALSELFSIGSIVPFLSVLSEPSRLWNIPLVQHLSTRLSLNGPEELIFPFAGLFCVAIVVTALVRLTNIWLAGRLAAVIGSDLSCEAFRRTLYQPYSVHIGRNSSYVVNIITLQINVAVKTIDQVLNSLTALLVAISILSGLFFIDSIVASSCATVLAFSYILIARGSRNELLRNSRTIFKNSEKRLKTLNEGLGAVRDVIIDKSQMIYTDVYSRSDFSVRVLTAKNAYIAILPRYAMEAVGLVAISFISVLVIYRTGATGNYLPVLGAFALGAQRLLPSLQQIYLGWSRFKSSSEQLNGVLDLLDQKVKPEVKPFYFDISPADYISIDNVSFSYVQSNSQLVLKKVCLSIPFGQKVGIIGDTGSGKSTLVDILLGLLVPTQGSIKICGTDIYSCESRDFLSGWMSYVSHVPQNIFLTDSSIAENIAFGTPKNKIDIDRVFKAAQGAQILSYIESTPDGFDSIVGERGIRLSGGQRQRIGIARALYKNSKVLILDEATSALDVSTEASVMSAIERWFSSLTIIMIAHRHSTLMRCDRVIKLEGGEVVGDGVPSDLL